MVYINSTDIWCAVIGGVLIGVATTINLLTYGRITGNSGIFNTLIKLKQEDGLKWKISFFSGLITSTYLVYLITDRGLWKSGTSEIYFFDPYPKSYTGLSTLGWIIGGILVGAGTKMGNGCTSGHGVCGIPRLSIRSLVAVPTFMACDIIYHFFETTTSFGSGFEGTWEIIGGILALLTLLGFIWYMMQVYKQEKAAAGKLEMPISWGVGFIFGLGLVISGMCRRSKILGFLTLNSNWDPSLMFVMVGAIGVNIFTFQYIINSLKQPYYAPKLVIPANKTIDKTLICGAALFGCGWGLSGLCPGPGMVNFFTMTHCLLWIPSLAAGQIGYEVIDKIVNGNGSH